MTMRGYIGQEYEVRPVLAAMEDRGVPIDDSARIQLGAEFEATQQELGVELAKRAPVECQRVHPKDGYKGIPPQVKEWQKVHCAIEIVDDLDKEGVQSLFDRRFLNVETRFQDSPKTAKDGTIEEGEWYSYQRRDFQISVASVDTSTLEPTAQTSLQSRWCRIYDFNPNSAPQLIAYMKAKGHRVPKSKIEDEDGNQKDTTAAKELQRLAVKTDDDFYLKVIEYRGLTKLRGTYVDGFRPGADGRVHTTFTFQTAIAQLSSRNPNCFSPDTEVLCKRGWIKFSEIVLEDYLAQYSNKGIISFALPKQLIQRRSDGVLRHIHTDEQLDMMMTPGHNCLLRNRKTLEWKWINASEYPEDFHQMQAGLYEGGDLYYSEGQIALICALQADGHVSKATPDYHGGAYEFAFTKERKTSRLLSFLDDLGIRYSHRVKSVRHNIRISHKDIPEWWKDKKYFGPWILDLTRDSLNYFEREVWFWDGCASKFSQYSSSVACNADWVQIACILSNRRAKIRKHIPPSGNPNWQIDAIKDNYSLTTNHKNEEVPYDGLIYCATMPLGTLIVRRNGKVAITGNCTNFPKLKPTPKLAKALRGMICADEGHVIAEVDFKSCHVITLGLLAGDDNYTRLGRLDIHSAVAGHFLQLWDLNQIIKESDDALMQRFKWLKSDPERKRVRDDQAKHGILGIGNGLRAKGLYERYMESFPARGCPVCGGGGKVAGVRGLKNCGACKGSGRQSGMSIAEAVLTTCEELFPKVFEYQEAQRREAHETQRLRTPFGHLRRFYEVYRWDGRKGCWSHGDQAEEAVAYRLANTAHAHMREVMKELFRRGLDKKYGLFNMVHDSIMMSYPEHLTSEMLREVIPVMVAESKVMPGLWLGVEVSQGRRWSEMKEVEIPPEILHGQQMEAQNTGNAILGESRQVSGVGAAR